MACSSRSLAERSGRCRVQPSRRSSRQVLERDSRILVVRSMTWATRSRVHRSLSNPLAVAPASSARVIAAVCSPERAGGRPLAWRRRSALVRPWPRRAASVGPPQKRPRAPQRSWGGPALGEEFCRAQAVGFVALWSGQFGDSGVMRSSPRHLLSVADQSTNLQRTLGKSIDTPCDLDRAWVELGRGLGEYHDSLDECVDELTTPVL
jgi:hypothetical protein